MKQQNFRLLLCFNRRDSGRLYQLLATINQMGASSPAATHQKLNKINDLSMPSP
jgi:hypothetical protein